MGIMANVIRFDGFLVDNSNDHADCLELFRGISEDVILQQLHLDEAEFDGKIPKEAEVDTLLKSFRDASDSKVDRPTPREGQMYRHFKTGKVVTVICISKHTETGVMSIVYECDGLIWDRPLSMFMSKVDRDKYKEASQEYRFELVSN